MGWDQTKKYLLLLRWTPKYGLSIINLPPGQGWALNSPQKKKKKKQILHVGMRMVNLMLAKSGIGHCPCPLNIPKTSHPQEISLITSSLELLSNTARR